jgi:hypothetical protein
MTPGIFRREKRLQYFAKLVDSVFFSDDFRLFMDSHIEGAMIEIRRSVERGRGEFDWLDARYSFSFADYFDPNYRGFRCLRVLNEDRIAPGRGFDPHPHENMEIISYVVSGELTHEDSMGNQRVIHAGEFQLMSAGSGVVHSEYNRHPSKLVHLVQIWITPDVKGLDPLYFESRDFNKPGRVLVASPSGRDDSMRIHQDVEVSRWELTSSDSFSVIIRPQRFAWLQVIKGEVVVDDEHLSTGDGAMISMQQEIAVSVPEDCHALFFDLP